MAIQYIFNPFTSNFDAVDTSSAIVPKVSMYGSTQSIPNNAQTKYLLQNTNFDTDGMADPVTNFRININTTGTYFINANILWSALINGASQIYIILNGTTTVASDINYGGLPLTQSCNNFVSLTSGDYLELFLLQSSGLAKNAVSSMYETTLSAFLVL